MYTISIQQHQNCRSSRHKITNILYASRQMAGQTSIHFLRYNVGIIKYVAFSFVQVNSLSKFGKAVCEHFCLTIVTDDHSFEHCCFPIQIQYLTTALGRILFSSVVMVLAFLPGGPGSNPVPTLYFCYSFIHLFLC